MLPQSDAARIGLPGTAVTVDGEKLHCCVAASWQRLVFGPVGWSALQLQLILADMLKPDVPDDACVC